MKWIEETTKVSGRIKRRGALPQTKRQGKPTGPDARSRLRRWEIGYSGDNEVYPRQFVNWKCEVRKKGEP